MHRLSLLGPLTISLLLMALTTPTRMALTAPTQEPGNVETATIDVSLIGRRIGTETYELSRTADGLTLEDSFAYVDRGGEVALETTLQLADDLTPRHLRAEGRTYRFLRVDIDARIEDGRVTIDNLGARDTFDAPEHFFALPGYAPLAGRALLIRYWEGHGRPEALPLIPGNPTHEVGIVAGGTDTIDVDGASITLRRFVVRNVAWGREVVWLDEDDRLAAIFTRANILPLDGVRNDLATARPQLEQLAVAVYMEELEALSATVEPRARGDFALIGGRLVDGTASGGIKNDGTESGGTDNRGTETTGSESGVVEDAVVVVRDGRIAAAGPRATTPIPEDVETIDVSGATIVPGLWDMHAHAAQIEWAPAYLAAGVTTVRDMGGGFAFLTAFRDTLADGRAVGPRLLLAGLVDGAHDNAFGEVTAATPAEGRAVVDRYHDAGFQQMKLYSNLQPDVVRAITARAHELGMTVTGHVPRALTLSEALDAGMDQVAHLPVRGDPGSPGAEEIIEALRAHGAAVDPTASWGELLGRSQQTPIADFQPGILAAPWPIASGYDSVRNEATPAEVAERMQGTFAGLRALHDAGIPLLAGTDYGVPAHSLHRELELYVAAGLTPLEALRAASAVPAAIMGLDADSGTIEPGKRADLLIVDGNPLDDISAIRNGRWVVADGVMYESASLWKAADFTPSR